MDGSTRSSRPHPPDKNRDKLYRYRSSPLSIASDREGTGLAKFGLSLQVSLRSLLKQKTR